MCAAHDKMLALAKEEAKHCDLEQVETNTINRLAAAFILRGTPVWVSPKLQVAYELILEWMPFKVATQQGTRSWGLPNDIQMLTNRLTFHYPLGIIVIHHELGTAFKFDVNDPPFTLEVSRALQYTSLYKGCLTLARFQIDDAKCVFAYVTVENTGGYVRGAESLCPRDLLITNAIHIPDIRTGLGHKKTPGSWCQAASICGDIDQ